MELKFLNKKRNLKYYQIASEILFKWTDVPIVFPPSITGLIAQNDSKVGLFTIPSDDDLDAISTDANGNRKKLSKDQLESIKKYG